MHDEWTVSDLQQAYDSGARAFDAISLVEGSLAGVALDGVAWQYVVFGKIDLADVTFSDGYFLATSFRDANLATRVSFRSCTFLGVDFRGADLKNTLFVACTFIRTTFAGASLRDVAFDHCTFATPQPEHDRTLKDRQHENVTTLLAAFDSAPPRTAYRRAYGNADFDLARLTFTAFGDCVFDTTRFSHASFVSTYFTRCRFDSAVFASAILDRVEFANCRFDRARLDRAELHRTSFRSSELVRSTFGRTTCEQVDFPETVVRHAELGYTFFLATELGPFCDSLDTLSVGSAPVIDWRSITRSSRLPSLEAFLRRCGVPEIFAKYMIDSGRAVAEDVLYKMMRTTFISYGAPDAPFARALCDELEIHGVRTFLFEKDAVPGERLHGLMHDNINRYDRVILICSRPSLSRHGVRNEIEETFAREARDGGASYLIPVSRDNYVFESTDKLIVRIRDRVVANFVGIEPATYEFRVAVQKLLIALRRDDTGA